MCVKKKKKKKNKVGWKCVHTEPIFIGEKRPNKKIDPSLSCILFFFYTVPDDFHLTPVSCFAYAMPVSNYIFVLRRSLFPQQVVCESI